MTVPSPTLLPRGKKKNPFVYSKKAEGETKQTQTWSHLWSKSSNAQQIATRTM